MIFLTLIRQELLTHLMSARFFAAVIITLLLVVANTFVLIGAHEERLADYSQKEGVNRETVAATPAYSVLKLKVQRPPNPLSLFSAGLETRFGSDIDIAFDSVPALSNPIADVRPEEAQWTFGSVPSLSSRGTPLGLNKPYLFSQIDIVFTFQVVLSLLSLLFAYDAIAGDWETGTLRLVLSHPVGRGSVLLAKYLAAMVCLLLPVLMSLLLALIQCSLAPSLQLSTEDFLRIGGIVLTTIVYLSVFYLIGLLISTTTRRAATSLMLCMFLWVVLVLVYPNWSRFALNPVGGMRAEKLSANQQIAQIREEADRERDRFLASSPLKGDPPIFFDTFAGTDFFKGGGWYLGDFPRVNIQIELKNTTDTLVTHLRRYYEFAATLQIQNAEKVYLVGEQLVAQISHRQAQWDERLMKLSPASLYTFATAAWAGTDLDSMTDYIRAAQTYRRTLIDAFHERDTFASLQWFSTNQGTVDWSILPDFRFEQADVSINAQRALPELLLLVSINLVLFTLTFLVFIKIEV